MPLSYALAVMALVTPGLNDEDLGFLRSNECELVKNYSVSIELMEDREISYVSLSTLRDRYLQTNDAPHILELMRFPNEETVNGLLEFNEKCLTYYTLKRDSEGWSDYTYEINELNKARLSYSTLRDAIQASYCVSYRRDKLAELKELLGDQDFYAGYLSPSVPYYLFKRVN